MYISMNSLILNAFLSIGKYIRKIFMNSLCYRIINTIFTFFSGGWEKSSIMSFLRKNERVGMSGKSLFYNVAHFPFLLFEFLNEVIGRKFAGAIENSVILRISRSFAAELLLLDTKTIGILLLSGNISRVAVTRTFLIANIVVGLIGLILVLMPWKITTFFGSSKIINLALDAFSLEFPSMNLEGKISVKKVVILVFSGILGLIAGILPLKLAILLIGGFVGAALVLMYPIAGVFFAVFAAPFVPTMVLAMLCILTFGSLIIYSICAEGFKWRFDGLGNALVVFLMFMLTSCILSFAAVKSLMVWAMYLVFVSFYFVIINTVKTKEQLVSVLKVFVIAGLLVSVYGIMQYAFGWTNSQNAWIDEEMFEEAVVRIESTMENPNVLGEFLLLFLPLAAVFMLKEKFSKLSKYVYAFAFAAGCLCMLLTQSRGCWLGLILACAIFVTFYNGRLWALLPIVILTLPFVMPETMVARMMSVGNMEDSSTSYRVFIWRGTFKMLKDFWVGGIGMGEGAFRLVYPLYSYNGIIAPHAHNTFLQLVVEGGIGALLIFITIMAVFIKKISVSFRETKKGSVLNLLTLAIGSGVIGFLLQSMFDYTFYNYRMMAMFFMIIALGMSFKYIREDA